MFSKYEVNKAGRSTVPRIYKLNESIHLSMDTEDKLYYFEVKYRLCSLLVFIFLKLK